MIMKAQWLYIWAIALTSVFPASSQSESLRIRINEDSRNSNITAKLEIKRGGNNKTDFVCDEGHWLSQAGEPLIPWTVATVLLPPDADLSTVACGAEVIYEQQAGEWRLEPAPPSATWDEKRSQMVTVWPTGKRIVGGYDLDIYETDAFWPSGQARILTVGRLRDWRLAEVALPLVRYNPITGELHKLISADVEVTYTREEISFLGGVISLRGKSRVEKMAVNFQEASQEYGIFDKVAHRNSIQKAKETAQYQLREPSQSANRYVILTTSSIQSASTQLSNFILHKESLGFTVQVVTEDFRREDSTHYLSGSTCDERAGNIRHWLKINYDEPNEILYVLLIGNPHPTFFDVDTSVPMKKCTSNPNTPNNHPTDYFFAELTADWDKDRDGLYGEMGESASDGNEVDKYFEVYVGRIPYYGNINDLDHILQKTINYENSTDVQWRRNIFLPMVPFEPEEGVLSYELGEQIKKDHLEPEGISSVRIYDECYADTVPPPEHLRRNRYPATEWKQGTYGLVVWLTHGMSDYATGIIATSYTPRLNDDYPSATWQGSCGNGDPSDSDNLAYAILRNGGITTVGASGGANYWIPERNYRHLSGSVGGMAYEYAKRMVQRQTCGEALYNTKEEMDMWLGNYYSFNLYGDPSVVVMPELPAFTVSPTAAFHIRFAHSSGSYDSRTYTLTNNTDLPLWWTATHEADWFELSSPRGRGVIDAHSSIALNMRLTAKTVDLDYGTHEDTVIFMDSTNNILIERRVVLDVYPQQLAGYWRLDEGEGNTAYDSSGRGIDGTIHNTGGGLGPGGAVWDTDFKRGTVLSFSGDDMKGAYVSAGTIAPMRLTNDFTWAFWCKQDAGGTGVNEVILGNRYGGTASPLQFIKFTPTKFEFFNDDYNYEESIIYPESIPDDYWIHHVVVKDGTTLTYYRNGVKSATKTIRKTVDANPLYMGGDALGERWRGWLSDVRIYDRALMTDEILTIMEGGWQAESPRPFDRQRDVPQRWTLDWVAASAAVYHDVYFGTSYDAVAGATTASPQYMGAQSEASYIPFMNMNTEYFWRVDEVTSGPDVIKGDVWSFTTGSSVGTITRAVWTGIDGSSVVDLTSYRWYPSRPNILEEIPSFEGPINWGDHYGTLIHGFLTPPRTGSYTFWIAGDDNCELWLSSDTNPANQVKIAEVPGWVDPFRWEKDSVQQSDPITLTAGTSYYIKALHKEGIGGDCLAVSWQGPGISQRVIPGHYLAPYDLDPP